MMTLTARIDYENNAKEFWEEFRFQIYKNLPTTSELVRNCRELLVSDDVELRSSLSIAEFKNFVTNLDGWNSGPEHAKHPIIFVETAVEKAPN